MVGQRRVRSRRDNRIKRGTREPGLPDACIDRGRNITLRSRRANFSDNVLRDGL
jgi:hypothetical protein